MCTATSHDASKVLKPAHRSCSFACTQLIIEETSDKQLSSLLAKPSQYCTADTAVVGYLI